MRLRTNGTIAAMTFGAFMLSPATSTAGSVFLQIGEFRVEVLSSSFGVGRAGSLGAAGDRGAGAIGGGGKLTVQVPVGAATQQLGQAVATGRHFQTAQLEVVGSGGRTVETDMLEDVMVTSVNLSNGPHASESFTLSYAKIKIAYAPSEPVTRPADRMATPPARPWGRPNG